MDRGRTKGAVNVEGIRAGYLKIVKADTAGRERAAQEERKEGIATEDSVARPGERGAFKVMAFHWRCYKFICHNLLYAALLAYLYMPSSGHTQVPLARDRSSASPRPSYDCSQDDRAGRGRDHMEGGRQSGSSPSF